MIKKLPKTNDSELFNGASGETESWHAFEIMAEFVSATEKLKEITPAVSIFGSARTKPDHPYYQLTEEIARALSDAGFSVISGGGPGIMEAANKGAYDTGSDSIGLNILLPHEQSLNEYTTANFQFEHFFGRKVAMTLDASGYLFFAGGFGTLDELFEILALEQTGKIPRAPIILVGSDFWGPIDEVIRNTLLDRFQTINGEDHQLYSIVDDHDEILRRINAFERESNR